MNLWAKSLGRLAVLAVALFFFSCEDETSLIGFRNPNSKFKVAYVDIPLESSVLTIDSIITDYYATSGNHVVGYYNDPVTGKMKAVTYLDLAPGSTSKLDAGSVYDSLTIQIRLNFSSYGFTGEQRMNFNVHQAEERLFTDSLRRRYYYNTSVAYKPELLGMASVVVDYDSLKKSAGETAKDTILIKGKLDDVFGSYLFNLALNDVGGGLSDPTIFSQDIKGLVLTPADETGLLGIDLANSLSKVILHYHTATDTLEKSFVFNKAALTANFTNFIADRSATEFSSIVQPYQSYTPASGLRVVQNGSPLITRLDLSKFYSFADTIDNLLVNSAELVIHDVGSQDGLPPHNAFWMALMHNNDDMFVNAKIKNDSVFARYRLANISNHLYIASERVTDPVPEFLGYDSEEDKYSAFITLFTQGLFKNRKINDAINPNRLRYIAVYPNNPGPATSVARTAFSANNVKLRIYYTTPVGGAPNN